MRRLIRSFAGTHPRLYTFPLECGKYKVTPARAVPVNIQRPGYVGNPNYPHHDLVSGTIRRKDPALLEKMRAAGKVAALAVKRGMEKVQLGATSDDVDEVVHNTIVEAGAYPSPIDYYGFPKSVCISVNEQVVHGVPDLRPFQEGDYVNIDVTCYLDGVHGDSSGMATVGNVHPDVFGLVKILCANWGIDKGDKEGDVRVDQDLQAWDQVL